MEVVTRILYFGDLLSGQLPPGESASREFFLLYSLKINPEQDLILERF